MRVTVKVLPSGLYSVAAWPASRKESRELKRAISAARQRGPLTALALIEELNNLGHQITVFTPPKVRMAAAGQLRAASP